MLGWRIDRDVEDYGAKTALANVIETALLDDDNGCGVELLPTCNEKGPTGYSRPHR